MIFGRSGQRPAKDAGQAAGYQGAPGAAGYGGMPGTPGYNGVPGTPGYNSAPGAAGSVPGAQAPSWTGAGYPSQPSGTGYAGYTPGAGAQTGGNAGYAPAGQAGYAQSGNYAGFSQPASGYAQPYARTGSAFSPGGQGFAQTGGNAVPGGMGYAVSGQNTAPGAQGYAAAGTGYAAGGQGYAPAGQGYAALQASRQAGQGYAQPQSYSQPGQAYPQAQGGYYPQMNAPGYAAQGASSQGYQSGYNAFAQMGRNQTPPQDYAAQIPLNGGGYVPPAVPVRKQPFVFKPWMLLALGAVLAALLAAGLFLPSAKMLLWVFLALALGSIALFWVKPLISGNRRLCYTVIFGVLSVIALLSALGLLQPRADTARTPSQPAAQATSQPSGGGTVIDPETGNVFAAVEQPEITASPTPVAEDRGTTDRLESFFRFWSANQQDEMLTLCAPSWQSSVDNPKTSLFGLLANRKPLDYTVENVSGTVDDTSRKVTVTSTMDRNNGKDPVKYRLSVLMLREGDQWFVDPQSLKTYEEAETPDPALADTPTPSPEPQVNGSTVLYYNPDGGTKYHLDQNCKSTHAKYLPMKGHFTYAEINQDKYLKLTPCNVCAAPLRP